LYKMRKLDLSYFFKSWWELLKFLPNFPLSKIPVNVWKLISGLIVISVLCFLVAMIETARFFLFLAKELVCTIEFMINLLIFNKRP
jgi:hypothetical protein